MLQFYSVSWILTKKRMLPAYLMSLVRPPMTNTFPQLEWWRNFFFPWRFLLLQQMILSTNSHYGMPQVRAAPWIMSALAPSEYIRVEGTVLYIKVAHVLCHGIFEVSTFISKHRSTGSTQKRVLAALEIFKEVAQIAHYFNRLIWIALKEALKLEQEYHILGALPSFLSKLHALTNVDSSGHKPAVADDFGYVCLDKGKRKSEIGRASCRERVLLPV